MRILIINQPYYPDVVATAQHMADLAEYLAARGHDVTVIASRSVYGTPGASLQRRESRNGVQIHRVGSNLFRKGRILTRLVDFAFFHARALAKALTLPWQDVVICLTTPPFIGIVGMLTKDARGSRYIQYEMDLYPDVSIALGVLKPNGFPARLLERLHKKLLESADRVVVLGRCMQRVIESKGIAAEKLALVTPWADETAIEPIPHDQNAFRQKHNLQNHYVIMYSGNLGLAHDTGTIIAAMERLKETGSFNKPHCGIGTQPQRPLKFVFVGGGRRMEALKLTLGEKKLLDNVLLLPYEPRENLSQLLSAADLHLITQAQGTTGIIVPSKLYGILAAGRPVLYVGPADTEIALTLIETNAGVVVSLGDSEAFLAALQTLRSQEPATQQMVSRAALESHTRMHCVSQIAALIEAMPTSA